jgi:hypothetical protein
MVIVECRVSVTASAEVARVTKGKAASRGRFDPRVDRSRRKLPPDE